MAVRYSIPLRGSIVASFNKNISLGGYSGQKQIWQIPVAYVLKAIQVYFDLSCLLSSRNSRFSLYTSLGEKCSSYTGFRIAFLFLSRLRAEASPFILCITPERIPLNESFPHVRHLCNPLPREGSFKTAAHLISSILSLVCAKLSFLYQVRSLKVKYIPQPTIWLNSLSITNMPKLHSAKVNLPPSIHCLSTVASLMLLVHETLPDFQMGCGK